MPGGYRCPFPPRRSPGLLLQLLLLIQRLREKWGGSPRDALAGAFERTGGRPPGGEGRPPPGPGRGAASPLLALGVAHPCLGQGPTPRRGEGMGAGWEVSLSSSPCLPALSSATGSLFLGCGAEDACALGAFERGVLGIGADPYKDPLLGEGPMPGPFTA